MKTSAKIEKLYTDTLAVITVFGASEKQLLDFKNDFNNSKTWEDKSYVCTAYMDALRVPV